MRISTEIASFKQYGTNKQILQLLKNAGFEAYDFSMFLQTPECFIYDDDYLAKARDLRQFADEIGIECNQAHSPFPLFAPERGGHRQFVFEQLSINTGMDFSAMSNADEQYTRQLQKLINRSLEIAGILGAKNCVVHPVNHFDAQQNCQMYQQFVDVAQKSGVRIAVENMWNWTEGSPCATSAACSHHDDFKRHMDLLPADLFVACLDIGHAEMHGLDTDSYKMITALSNRLACLHVHDNDMRHDDHQLPFTSKIPFDRMCKALAEMGYDGDLTFEADSYMCRFDNEFFPTATKYMYDVGCYLRDKINAYR